MEGTQGGSDQKAALLSAVALTLLVSAVYANSLQGPFVLDDVPQIRENVRIRSLWPIGRILTGSERPIAELSFAINYAIHGFEIVGYHAGNLIVHLSCALLLCGIARRALCSDRMASRYGPVGDRLAFAIAALWAVHPLQTQAVTYIVQRHESQMGLFYLAAIYAVARCAVSRSAGSRLGWSLFAFVMSVLGMATKQVMATAPLVALLYDRTFFATSYGEALRKRAAMYTGFALSWGALCLVIGGSVWDPEEAGFIGRDPISPIDYLFSQTGVLLHYLSLVVWPRTLVFDYGWQVAHGFIGRVLPTIIVTGLGLATVWALWKKPALGFLGASFFLILAPTSSVMPIADLAYEHRMYLPSSAVIALLVLGTHRLLEARSRRLETALFLAALLALSIRTSRRNCDYQTQVALWRSVVQAVPHNPRGHINLGIAHAQEAQDMASARATLEQALVKFPGNVRVLVNLAGVLVAEGEPEAAVRELRKVLLVAPDNAEVLANLAVAQTATGDRRGAVHSLARSLEIQPDHAAAWNNLGVLHLEENQLEEAVGAFSQALRVDPAAPNARENLERATKLLERRSRRRGQLPVR